MPWSPQRKFKLEALNRDERYLSIPERERLLLRTLMEYVDAAGREVANSRVLRETFYELDDAVQASDVDSMLAFLESRNWLLQYIVGQRVLVQINPGAWTEFVTIDGRDGSRFPAPDPGPDAAQRAAWAKSGPTVAEGKGDGGERGEPEAPLWMLDDTLPPPQGCRLHPNNTGLIACGPCAGAGKIHKQFMSGEITHAEAVAAWGGVS